MEDSNDITIKDVALKYGLFNAVAAILFFVILDVMGMSGNQSLSWLGLVITAVVIFLGQKEYKTNGDGYMNYGEGLGIGTLLALISSIISSVFVWVYVSYINTNFIDNIRQSTMMKLEEQGMSDTEIDRVMEMSDKFSGPTAMLIFGILGGVFFGFLISLVISAIVKTTRPEFE